MSIVQVKCPKCGQIINTDNSDDAAICTSCGKAFVVEKAVELYNRKTICKYCGTEIFEGCRFCFSCGKEVFSNTNQTADKISETKSLPSEDEKNIIPANNTVCPNTEENEYQSISLSAEKENLEINENHSAFAENMKSDKYCSVCGNLIVKGKTHCLHCGCMANNPIQPTASKETIQKGIADPVYIEKSYESEYKDGLNSDTGGSYIAKDEKTEETIISEYSFVCHNNNEPVTTERKTGNELYNELYKEAFNLQYNKKEYLNALSKYISIIDSNDSGMTEYAVFQIKKMVEDGNITISNMDSELANIIINTD